MPTAWIADRLAVLSSVPTEKEKKEMDTKLTSRIHDPSSSRRGAGHPVLFDARELARSEVGRESKFGVSRLSRYGCFPFPLLLGSGDVTVLLTCAYNFTFLFCLLRNRF